MGIRAEVCRNVEFYEPEPLDFAINELRQYKRLKERIIKELADGGPRYCFLVDHIVGPQQFDLIALKREGIFSIDLKGYRGQVHGSENGDWTVVTANGVVTIKQNRNPFQQAKDHRFGLIRLMHDLLPRINQRFTEVDHIASLVCFEGGSTFDGVRIDPRNHMWFDVRDETTVIDFIRTMRSNQYLLTDHDMDELLCSRSLKVPRAVAKKTEVAPAIPGNRAVINGVETLRDILPDEGQGLRVLIVAKRPAPRSVHIGHYFQGSGPNSGHGPAFWRQLREHGILRMPSGWPKGPYEDDYLVDNDIGLTDMVKTPGEPGDEPTPAEYAAGAERIIRLIDSHRPAVLLFVYKKPLEHLLRAMHVPASRIDYGFNDHLNPHFRGARVFVCPLPGVGGATSEDIRSAMMELKDAVNPSQRR